MRSGCPPLSSRAGTAAQREPRDVSQESGQESSGVRSPLEASRDQFELNALELIDPARVLADHMVPSDRDLL